MVQPVCGHGHLERFFVLHVFPLYRVLVRPRHRHALFQMSTRLMGENTALHVCENNDNGQQKHIGERREHRPITPMLESNKQPATFYNFTCASVLPLPRPLRLLRIRVPAAGLHGRGKFFGDIILKAGVAGLQAVSLETYAHGSFLLLEGLRAGVQG